MKNITDKYYDSPLWVHFIVSGISTFLLVFVALHFIPLTKEYPPNLVMQVYLTLSISLGIIIGLMGMAMNWNGKKNDAFFRKMKEIREEVDNAKTAVVLQCLRIELVDYAKKHANSLTCQISNELLTVIDTRLEFEFKIKT